MKILVTGAGGLLGGRIIDFFNKKGYEIVAISRHFKGSVEWEKSVEIVNMDLNESVNLKKYLHGVSLVIHAAGTNAADSFKDPIKALYFNGLVTAKLLNESIKCGVPKFIYLSTLHVYSRNLSGLVNENNCIKNTHPYATSHRAGEDAVLFANNQKKIQGLVLRLSNSFGFPINKSANCWSLVVNDICRQVYINGKISLNSSGNQFRNFISINEVCRFICFLFENEFNYYRFPVLNLASKNTITVLAMSHLVKNRAEIFLNKKIPLSVKNEINNKTFKSFKMETSLLDSIGYSVNNDYEIEIDSLLNYCQHNFKIES